MFANYSFYACLLTFYLYSDDDDLHYTHQPAMFKMGLHYLKGPRETEPIELIVRAGMIENAPTPALYERFPIHNVTCRVISQETFFANTTVMNWIECSDATSFIEGRWTARKIRVPKRRHHRPCPPRSCRDAIPIDSTGPVPEPHGLQRYVP